jgi:hypothetical protein
MEVETRRVCVCDNGGSVLSPRELLQKMFNTEIL